MTARSLPISPVPDGVSLSEHILPKLPVVKFSIEFKNVADEQVRKVPEGFQECTILNTKLLTSINAVKPVYSFLLAAPEHKYLPGDSFDVICENSESRVTDLLNLLQIDPEMKIVIRGDHLLRDSLLSVRTLFKKYLGINQFPKKVFLRHLAEYTQDAAEKNTLLYLSSRLGSSQYLALAREYANLTDFLATFPSCKPTLDCVLVHSAPLSPRAYSICSYEKQSIEFICSIDSYTTPEPNPHKRTGICSEYLLQYVEDISQRSLWISPRPPTSMRFPEEYRPMIMVCAGAGLSPFIGFLRYASKHNIKLEESWLLYGFRSIEDDFLFHQELEVYLQNGTLGNLKIAVSRHPQNPQYVQDVLWENGDAIFQLMQEKQARIYLCGDEMTMIKSVNECLERICTEIGGNKPLLADWTKEKRIIRDIWV